MDILYGNNLLASQFDILLTLNVAWINWPESGTQNPLYCSFNLIHAWPDSVPEKIDI